VRFGSRGLAVKRISMENMSKFEQAIEKEATYLLQIREKIYKLELLKHVKEMRALQKDYFRTRDKNILVLSKQKEKEIDKLIHDIENPTLI
jgi:hypothetical protein